MNQIKKDEVQVLLRKKDPIDWKPFFDDIGFDQLNYSDESPDEETLEGFAAARRKRYISPEDCMDLSDLAMGVTTLYEIDIPKFDDGDKNRTVIHFIGSGATKRMNHDWQSKGFEYVKEKYSQPKSTTDDNDSMNSIHLGLKELHFGFNEDIKDNNKDSYCIGGGNDDDDDND